MLLPQQERRMRITEGVKLVGKTSKKLACGQFTRRPLFFFTVHGGKEGLCVDVAEDEETSSFKSFQVPPSLHNICIHQDVEHLVKRRSS